MSELFPELKKVVLGADGQLDDDSGWSAATRQLFAELAGDRAISQEVEESESVYHEYRARLSGPGLAAGLDATRRFEQALGLVGMLRSLKRTESGQIDFVAELPDSALAAGNLVPLGVRAWRTGKSFGVSYRDDLHPQLAKALLRFLARYDGVPFERILAQVVPDAGDEHMLAADYPESVFYAFATSSGWRRFFEGTELYRGACSGHKGRVAIVDHTDLECVFNQVTFEENLPSFFNVPLVEQDQDDAPLDAPAFSHSEESLHLLTDIQDRDVITGADTLLDRALQSLADHPNPPDLVIVQSGCLPEVTGDDLEASVARTRGKLRLPVVVVGNPHDIVGKSLGELVEQQTISPQRELDDDSVVFVGLPSFHGRRMLGELLERAGIRVAGVVLPELEHDMVERLARVPLFVLHPWAKYEVTGERLAARYRPARAIRPGVPFGVRATQRWLLAIADALGRRDAMRDVIEQEWSELASRWSAMRQRARGYRLGFVVDQPSWRTALDARRSFGVPMLEMLSEMGFGVDVLAFAGTSPIREQRFDDVRVRGYRDCDELAALLATDEVVAWYSEIHYDRRLTRSRKNPFSLRQFRIGMRGAVESLEELLHLAELPFYRRYGELLGTAFPELADRHAGAER